jgi:phosphoglycolate phosphatase
LHSAFRKAYRERAEQVMSALTVPLPGVIDTLTRLRSADISLGIISTKTRARLEETLALYDMRSLFDIVVGGDDVRAPKPDPEGVALALDRLRVASSAAIYVGDSLVDAQTAVNAAISFIAVTSGTTLAEEFASYPSRAIVRCLADLLPYLNLG